jgi:hypothetical protein
MGVLDLIRSPSRWLSSPATRRLYEAERAAETWSSAPAPSPSLSAASAGAPAKTPPINWSSGQPPAPPTRHAFRAGYDDHFYDQSSAPVVFDGFDLERIAAAKTAHRLGTFYESSAMMIAVLSFAPVLAALGQAIAPILALPRHVHGGESALARIVTAEVKEQLVPGRGLAASPYLPPQLWGTLAIYLRMMGFGGLQHIDGDMDPELGIRPRYTRIWEPWAIQRTRSPRKAIAYTNEGAVEVTNDGKFTIVEDTNEGYLFDAAVLAIGPEAAAGRITQDMRLKWLDFFSSPKLVATLPQHVPTQGQAGDAFVAALDGIYGPDGRGVLPFGSEVDAVSITGEGAGQFRDSIIDSIIHVFMVLTGSGGTVGSGGPTGAGPYQPKSGGAWNVLHHLVERPTIAIVRGINQGHVCPYVDQYPLDRDERPVLEVPVPQPDREERIASEIKRYKALTDQVIAETTAGAPPDQPRVDKLAEAFEVKPFQLADGDPKVGQIFGWHVKAKLVAPDEVRKPLGLPPLPDGMGSVERLAEERAAGGDETGALAKVDAAATKDDSKPEDVAAEEAPDGDDEGPGPGTLRSGKVPKEGSEGT